MSSSWIPSLHEGLESPEAIKRFAKRYSEFDLEKDSWIESVISEARNRTPRHLTRFDLVRLGRWKMGHQNKEKIKSNRNGRVERWSEASFSAKTDEERMAHIRELEGVGLAVASAFMHFAFPRDHYPIIDFRAVRSLGKETGKYGDSDWPAFLKECRCLRKRFKVDMRTLDRALWQFDLERDFCRQIAEDAKDLSSGDRRSF